MMTHALLLADDASGKKVAHQCMTLDSVYIINKHLLSDHVAHPCSPEKIRPTTGHFRKSWHSLFDYQVIGSPSDIIKSIRRFPRKYLMARKCKDPPRPQDQLK